ncbi:malto-oligosyltrehalose synthase [Streptomyces sp. URMC 123]|uniref:malto-oligosyltrehalose synthase n=1 Tax=Streptomyces sp. URMC 123 TaxID=3423403 RepID=UPI003F1BC023
MNPEPVPPPTATYRLQLQPDHPFSAVREAVPYLASLGVSHLHLSPVLEAVPGSTHGYDVVDHSAVRAELGGEEGLRALAATAREHGLGLVLDIVPNHMAVPAPERLNRALWEVLRDGPGSRYARWFDIDWTAHPPPKDAPGSAHGAPGAPSGRVLLPVLGGRLADELPRLVVDGDVLRYHDHAFPLRPGTAGLPLPELLDRQWYRLCWWRLARTELNYRRFFTISDLIGVRVQDEEVFEATHATVLALLRDGVVEGLRVDHPDGLADPAGYLRRLARRVREEAGGERWIVVEKILTGDERLPADWPVAGTTGYDALRQVDGLFVDPDGLPDLVRCYTDFTDAPADLGGEWPATARRAAQRVVTHDLAAEVDFLTRTAARICAADPATRDHAPWALRTAIRAMLLHLPVYRPYAVPGEEVSAVDAEMLTTAAVRARAAFTVPEEADTVEVVRDLALGRLGTSPDHHAFCARFAQTSSALRAKSVEDTAFYRFVPLLSAAEVGGEPGRPAVTPEGFHAFCARSLRDRPYGGTVLSTHDTKRSADVRAWLALLTEVPREWGEVLERVTKETARAGGSRAPDPHLAWLAWQTAFGFGYPHPDRVVPAVVKAAREAGLRTSWTEPDPVYEEAVREFVTAGPCGPPMATLAAFSRTLDPYARANILGAALLHLTMPGVPDVYQGSEQEYAALVDPDNRRPPRLHPRCLAALDEGAEPPGLSDEKLLLTATALRLRRAHPEWFGAAGGYEPLTARGSAADHLVAFCRAGSALTAVTRLPHRLSRSGGWRDTVLPLPPGRWRDALTGERAEGETPVTTLLRARPVALLTRE